MLKVRWSLLLLHLRRHSVILCSWTQMRKHFAHPLPHVKWNRPGGQNQKMEHTDFSVFHMAVCFRKVLVNFKFLFHVWCISPNSIENASRFQQKKFRFALQPSHQRTSDAKVEICCSPLKSSKRFSRLTYAAGHMYAIPMIIVDGPNSDQRSVN